MCSIIMVYGGNPIFNISDCNPILEKLEVIIVNQAQLLEVLTGVKTTVDVVSTNLTEVAADLTEATTEILAKIEELKGFDLSPEVVAIVDALGASTASVVEATTGVGTQAQSLADIVPNPQPIE